MTGAGSVRPCTKRADVACRPCSRNSCNAYVDHPVFDVPWIHHRCVCAGRVAYLPMSCRSSALEDRLGPPKLLCQRMGVSRRLARQRSHRLEDTQQHGFHGARTCTPARSWLRASDSDGRNSAAFIEKCTVIVRSLIQHRWTWLGPHMPWPANSLWRIWPLSPRHARRRLGAVCWPPSWISPLCRRLAAGGPVGLANSQSDGRPAPQVSRMFFTAVQRTDAADCFGRARSPATVNLTREWHPLAPREPIGTRWPWRLP